MFCSVLGTPSEQSWPGVTALQDWNNDFPVWPTLSLARFCANMGDDGLDLLEQMLAIDPRRRITARDAMSHPYFADFANGEV